MANNLNDGPSPQEISELVKDRIDRINQSAPRGRIDADSASELNLAVQHKNIRDEDIHAIHSLLNQHRGYVSKSFGDLPTSVLNHPAMDESKHAEVLDHIFRKTDEGMNNESAVRNAELSASKVKDPESIALSTKGEIPRFSSIAAQYIDPKHAFEVLGDKGMDYHASETPEADLNFAVTTLLHSKKHTPDTAHKAYLALSGKNAIFTGANTRMFRDQALSSFIDKNSFEPHHLEHMERHASEPDTVNSHETDRIKFSIGTHKNNSPIKAFDIASKTYDNSELSSTVANHYHHWTPDQKRSIASHIIKTGNEQAIAKNPSTSTDILNDLTKAAANDGERSANLVTNILKSAHQITPEMVNEATKFHTSKVALISLAEQGKVKLSTETYDDMYRNSKESDTSNSPFVQQQLLPNVSGAVALEHIKEHGLYDSHRNIGTVVFNKSPEVTNALNDLIVNKNGNVNVDLATRLSKLTGSRLSEDIVNKISSVSDYDTDNNLSWNERTKIKSALADKGDTEAAIHSINQLAIRKSKLENSGKNKLDDSELDEMGYITSSFERALSSNSPRKRIVAIKNSTPSAISYQIEHHLPSSTSPEEISALYSRVNTNSTAESKLCDHKNCPPEVAMDIVRKRITKPIEGINDVVHPSWVINGLKSIPESEQPKVINELYDQAAQNPGHLGCIISNGMRVLPIDKINSGINAFCGATHKSAYATKDLAKSVAYSTSEKFHQISLDSKINLSKACLKDGEIDLAGSLMAPHLNDITSDQAIDLLSINNRPNLGREPWVIALAHKIPMHVALSLEPTQHLMLRSLEDKIEKMPKGSEEEENLYQSILSETPAEEKANIAMTLYNKFKQGTIRGSKSITNAINEGYDHLGSFSKAKAFNEGIINKSERLNKIVQMDRETWMNLSEDKKQAYFVPLILNNNSDTFMDVQKSNTFRQFVPDFNGGENDLFSVNQLKQCIDKLVSDSDKSQHGDIVHNIINGMVRRNGGIEIMEQSTLGSHSNLHLMCAQDILSHLREGNNLPYPAGPNDLSNLSTCINKISDQNFVSAISIVDQLSETKRNLDHYLIDDGEDRVIDPKAEAYNDEVHAITDKFYSTAAETNRIELLDPQDAMTFVSSMMRHIGDISKSVSILPSAMDSLKRYLNRPNGSQELSVKAVNDMALSISGMCTRAQHEAPELMPELEKQTISFLNVLPDANMSSRTGRLIQGIKTPDNFFKAVEIARSKGYEDDVVTDEKRILSDPRYHDLIANPSEYRAWATHKKFSPEEFKSMADEIVDSNNEVTSNLDLNDLSHIISNSATGKMSDYMDSVKKITMHRPDTLRNLKLSLPYKDCTPLLSSEIDRTLASNDEDDGVTPSQKIERIFEVIDPRNPEMRTHPIKNGDKPSINSLVEKCVTTFCDLYDKADKEEKRIMINEFCSNISEHTTKHMTGMGKEASVRLMNTLFDGEANDGTIIGVLSMTDIDLNNYKRLFERRPDVASVVFQNRPYISKDVLDAVKPTKYLAQHNFFGDEYHAMKGSDSESTISLYKKFWKEVPEVKPELSRLLKMAGKDLSVSDVLSIDELYHSDPAQIRYLVRSGAGGEEAFDAMVNRVASHQKTSTVKTLINNPHLLASPYITKHIDQILQHLEDESRETESPMFSEETYLELLGNQNLSTSHIRDIVSTYQNEEVGHEYDQWAKDELFNHFNCPHDLVEQAIEYNHILGEDEFYQSGTQNRETNSNETFGTESGNEGTQRWDRFWATPASLDIMTTTNPQMPDNPDNEHERTLRGYQHMCEASNQAFSSLQAIIDGMASAGTETVTWEELKKIAPEVRKAEHPAVKSLFAKGQFNKPVSLEEIQNEAEKQKDSFFVTYGSYANDAQKHLSERNGDNYTNVVLQLHANDNKIAKIKQDPLVYGVFMKALEAKNVDSNHPLTPHAVSWVRLDCTNKKEIVIEEIQSDFDSTLVRDAYRFIGPNDTDIVTLPNGVTTTAKKAREAVKKVIDIIGDWRKASFDAVEKYAKVNNVEIVRIHGDGVRATMNSYDVEEENPVSFNETYRNLPPKIGYEKCDYSDYGKYSKDLLVRSRRHPSGTRCWVKRIRKPNT